MMIAKHLNSVPTVLSPWRGIAATWAVPKGGRRLRLLWLAALLSVPALLSTPALLGAAGQHARPGPGGLEQPADQASRGVAYEAVVNDAGEPEAASVTGDGQYPNGTWRFSMPLGYETLPARYRFELDLVDGQGSFLMYPETTPAACGEDNCLCYQGDASYALGTLTFSGVECETGRASIKGLAVSPPLPSTLYAKFGMSTGTGLTTIFFKVP